MWEQMGGRLGKAYLVFVFFLLYAPIVYLIAFSFNAGDTMYAWEGFSLDWYRELLHDERLFVIALNTLVIALASSILATGVGTAGALLIGMSEARRRREALLLLNNVLLVSPDVQIGISFLLLFTLAGIALGEGRCSWRTWRSAFRSSSSWFSLRWRRCPRRFSTPLTTSGHPTATSSSA